MILKNINYKLVEVFNLKIKNKLNKKLKIYKNQKYKNKIHKNKLQ